MAGPRTRRIQVARPLGVFILYATVGADDDIVRFYPDIYGHDAALAPALGALHAPSG
jgi:murein L,D-transpeptidase YcbB/YkuD